MTTNLPTKRRKYHVGMWLFLAVQVLFIFMIIVGVSSSDTSDCQGLDAQTCKSATDAGTAIGVGLVIGLWALVDVILGMIWLIVYFARKK